MLFQNRDYKFYFYSILIFAVMIRLLMINGFVYDDCMPYGIQAHHIAENNYNLNADLYYSMRISFILVQGFFVSLFGDNALGYFTYPFLAGILTIYIAMRFSKKYYGEKVSLYTGLMLATTPLYVVWSTIPHPDGLNPLLWSLFFIVFFEADNQINKRYRYLLFILAGFIVGFSFYTRIFSVVILLVAPLMMIYHKKIKFEYLWILAGFGFAFLIGNGVYYYETGDFFLRYHNTLLKKSYIVDMSSDVWRWTEFSPTFDFFKKSILDYVEYTVSFFHYKNIIRYSFVMLLTFISVGYLYKKNLLKKYYLVIIWFFSILISVDLILNNVTRLWAWQPYIMAIIVPGAILCAIFFEKIHIKKIVIIVLLLISLIFSYIYTKHTVEINKKGYDGVLEQIYNKSQCKSVYYDTYKHRVKLLPLFNFDTTYKYKMNYEKWIGTYANKQILFEFLPRDENKIKDGDCILINKERQGKFIQHDLDITPVFEQYYMFPKYYKNVDKNYKTEYENDTIKLLKKGY